MWFRAPEALADFQLANPEFRDHIDYSPKQVFGDKHEHVWNNFMAGNWAWRQCVSHFKCFCILVLLHTTKL